VNTQLGNLIDKIQMFKVLRGSFLSGQDITPKLQEIADAMPRDSGFTFGGVVYLPTVTSERLPNFNQLYGQCLISAIKEIQEIASEEEVFMISELFFLLPSDKSIIIIDGHKYYRCGKKSNLGGEILREGEILSHIISD